MGEEKKSFGQRMKDKWAGFKHFAHNKDDGTYLGRTGESWGKIGIFYLIYYAFLAAFFAICFAVFSSTLPDTPDGPKLHEFIIKPALDYIPRVPGKDVGGFGGVNYGTIVMYNGPWFDKYTVRLGENYPLPRGEFDPSFSPAALCNPTEEEPCIYFRLNRIYGWIPYNEATQTKFASVEILCAIESGPSDWVEFQAANGTWTAFTGAMQQVAVLDTNPQQIPSCCNGATGDDCFVNPNITCSYDSNGYPFSGQANYGDPYASMKVRFQNAKDVNGNFNTNAIELQCVTQNADVDEEGKNGQLRQNFVIQSCNQPTQCFEPSDD